MRVILKTRPRAKPKIPIEAEEIIPQNFLRRNDIRVFEGNKERALDDLFFITTEGPAVSPDQVEVILTGDTGVIKRVGEYMNAGRIIVEGEYRDALREFHERRGDPYPWKRRCLARA